MPIKFRCHQCKKLLSISTRKAGQNVNCPACGEATRVPLESAPAKPSDSTPAAKQSARIDDQRSPENLATTSNKTDSQEIPGKPDFMKPDTGKPGDSSVTKGSQGAKGNQGLGSAALPETQRRQIEMPVYHADEYEEDDDEEFSIKSAETEFEDMDLTPMVDVTFLLLIFFMVTASFTLQKSIEVPDPDPDKKGATQSIQNLDELLDESVKVEIDEKNTIFIDDEPLADLEQLSETLQDKLLTENKNELVLTASAIAFHDTVIQVIDAANEVGMQKIRMVSAVEE